jgi:hypothetical protein
LKSILKKASHYYAKKGLYSFAGFIRTLPDFLIAIIGVIAAIYYPIEGWLGPVNYFLRILVSLTVIIYWWYSWRNGIDECKTENS